MSYLFVFFSSISHFIFLVMHLSACLSCFYSALTLYLCLSYSISVSLYHYIDFILACKEISFLGIVSLFVWSLCKGTAYAFICLSSTLCILFVCKEISFLGIVSLFVWSTLFVFWGSMHLFVCLCMYLSGLTAWAFDFFLRAKAVYAVSWRVLGTLCVYLSMQRMYLSVHLSIFICSYSESLTLLIKAFNSLCPIWFQTTDKMILFI